jgi:predicted NAD/FAD-binding protein
MKIAIVGSGISGLSAALFLSKKHNVTVFEANNWLGGHVRTVPVIENDKEIWIDTGFIVCNNRNYPNFLELMRYLEVPLQATEMSFSVQIPAHNLEYNGSSLNGLFAQRKNIVNPKFWRMLHDISIFNRAAKKLVDGQATTQTLDAMIIELKLGNECIHYYLLPMISAIWSSNTKETQAMPAFFLCKFLDNHGLLTVNNRPQWYSLIGGSHTYVHQIKKLLGSVFHANTPVEKISRQNNSVQLIVAGEMHNFDKVFICTNANQAINLLSDPSDYEIDILKRFKYSKNEVALHYDTDLLPRNTRAWASWNYLAKEDATELCQVTYNMNILQKLSLDQTYCVSLNMTNAINATKLISTVEFEHPIFNADAVAAQMHFNALCGVNNTYYCGAYWVNGFHEDGLNSSIRSVQHLDKDLTCEAQFIQAW